MCIWPGSYQHCCQCKMQECKIWVLLYSRTQILHMSSCSITGWFPNFSGSEIGKIFVLYWSSVVCWWCLFLHGIPMTLLWSYCQYSYVYFSLDNSRMCPCSFSLFFNTIYKTVDFFSFSLTFLLLDFLLSIAFGLFYKWVKYVTQYLIFCT